MLEKTFRPSEVEARHYADWEASGAFAADPRSNKPPFALMMPPPNVTGSLHMGHALTFTLQDIVIRHQRMKGRDALWQPGMDHAGIATQMVVERQLAAEGLDRRQLGREEFERRVWRWKEQSGGAIMGQLRRLGASADWARERFTLDPALSRAVREVFVDLYRQGLIYRDTRLVNWDPKLLTAISDLEVVAKETEGKLWHLRYPLAGETNRFVTVATTRPETMLADAAVAVHPEDPRYRDLIGRHVILPIAERPIPIIADAHADPETGSGAVKITPAHDFDDYQVGKRHGLPMIDIFDAHARLNELAPPAYRGLDRYAARDKIVAELVERGLIEKIEDHRLSLPVSDRSGVAVEPRLTEQWYCDAATLARPAIAAVEEGRTRFVPRQWENTYFEWMRNIQPWCISRQLWWGHRIPAWYDEAGEVFVAMDEAEALTLAERRHGRPVALRQDEDVLDTWFSSALWPFSTLGWPERTPELARYYPGDVLVTGFDIIFFWVARMMMMGLHFMRDVPFRTVYIHALVRDQSGQKMSKSKGNVIDPLHLIETYGSDALRFTLAALAAQGRDVKMAASRVEGYRNFATKLWNATRFCQMNEARADPAFDPAQVRAPVNRWMIGRLAACAAAVDQALAAFRFNDAAAALYRCAWHEFCDWYLEFAKPILQGEDAAAKAETRAAAAWILGRLLHLLHPIMPFITEELWDEIRPAGAERLIAAGWPDFSALPIDAEAMADIDWVVRLVGEVRALRAEMNVPPAAQASLLLRDADARTQARARRYGDLVKRLARAERLDLLAAGEGKASAQGAAQIVLDEATVLLPLAGLVDLAKERTRLGKDRAAAALEAEKIARKLDNPQFLAKADPDIVDEQRDRAAELAVTLERLDAALARLAG